MTDISQPAAPRPRGNVAVVLASASLMLSVLSLVLLAFLVAATDVLGTGGASGDRANDRLPVQSQPELATPSQVEALAHVTLPPGTVFLSAAYTNGLESRISAKFRIPRDALDSFLSHGKFTGTPKPGIRAVTGEDDVGKGNLWKPDAAVSVAGLIEEEPLADGTLRKLLLDLDDADTVMVYLYAVRN